MGTNTSMELSVRMSKRHASCIRNDAVIRKLADRVMLDGLELGKLRTCPVGICVDYCTNEVPELYGVTEQLSIVKWEVFPVWYHWLGSLPSATSVTSMYCRTFRLRGPSNTGLPHCNPWSAMKSITVAHEMKCRFVRPVYEIQWIDNNDMVSWNRGGMNFIWRRISTDSLTHCFL